jgi:glutathione S-transferase
VTAGNLTFVEWTVDFSKDVSNEAMVDASFKAREHFKALAATSKAKLLEQAASTPVGKQKVTVPELRRQLSARSTELNKLFTSLDKNGNGVLEFDEFALAVNKLYGENLADEAIRMLLRMADTNNDNVVSYEEFVKFLEAEGLEAKALGKAAAAKDDVKAAVVLPGDVTLHYFPARGRAEVARLLMAEAGIKYTDNRMDYKKFTETLKAKLPFGQMPALTVGKSTIAQSQAINRYLAKAAGLYGKNAEDMARIDMITETWYGDIGTTFSNAWYNKDPKAKEAGIAKFWAETFPTYTAQIEKLLAGVHSASKTPVQWFVGNAFSLADIVCYDSGFRYLGMNKDCLNSCPLLHQLITRVSVRPKIAQWIKSRPQSDS